MLEAFQRLHDRCLQRQAPLAQVGAFGAPKPAARSARKPHGYWERTGPYGELEEGDTLSCCHCGAHWEVRVGSDRVRGFCTRCLGYTCGSPLCVECVPVEQRLENQEAGLPVLTPGQARILVPTLPPTGLACPTNNGE